MVELSIAVGCDGRVSAVKVLDGGGVASGTLSCLQIACATSGSRPTTCQMAFSSAIH